MAYDAEAESLRLIESRELTPATRLSRRRRYVPMAVDVSDDIAVTMFARRSVGCNVEETYILVRRGNEWTMLGGGGGPLDDDALDYRPAVLPSGPSAHSEHNARVVRTEGAGGVLDSGARRLWPGRGRWINYCIVRVNAEVAHVVVEGRHIAVPWHGRCVVGWVGQRPKEVVVLAQDGRQMEQFALMPAR
ncbi:hypothetical protein [Ornithinimicrobium panacihumi]|uniref:hypothetical protein n=1 Tax=Ornithinimicrobium panacihumi TaxID=2008449 RepID=UPI003F8A2401